jgi:hypothetical protein
VATPLRRFAGRRGLLCDACGHDQRTVGRWSRRATRASVRVMPTVDNLQEAGEHHEYNSGTKEER